MNLWLQLYNLSLVVFLKELNLVLDEGVQFNVLNEVRAALATLVCRIFQAHADLILWSNLKRQCVQSIDLV